MQNQPQPLYSSKLPPWKSVHQIPCHHILKSQAMGRRLPWKRTEVPSVVKSATPKSSPKPASPIKRAPPPSTRSERAQERALVQLSEPGKQPHVPCRLSHSHIPLQVIVFAARLRLHHLSRLKRSKSIAFHSLGRPANHNPPIPQVHDCWPVQR